MWLNGNKNNSSPFPVLFSAAVTVTTFHPQPDSHHTSIFSCNHVTMQMVCTERFMLPSPGHHSQLPEPLSWPPKGGRRGSHYCYQSQAQSLYCQTAPPTHKVLDDFTKTSNFSRTPFIMTNRNQSLQPLHTPPESVCLFGCPKWHKKKESFPPNAGILSTSPGYS